MRYWKLALSLTLSPGLMASSAFPFREGEMDFGDREVVAEIDGQVWN